MGFDAYFLIVWDLATMPAKTISGMRRVVSAAGSIVAYTLDITLVGTAFPQTYL
jgi:DNA polymerase III alpha subunit